MFKVSYSLLNYSRFRLFPFNNFNPYPTTIHWWGDHSIPVTMNTDITKKVDLFGEFQADFTEHIKCAIVVRTHDPSQVLVLFISVSPIMDNQATVCPMRANMDHL